jgi:spore coat polysaccharide biosynthesis protein SpsF
VKVIAVVHARFTSERLPGKVLRPLCGRPLISHLLDGLSRCRTLDGIVLATSIEPSDDAIARFATDSGADCVRGPLVDVAARILQAAASRDADAVVRLSGDSPLLDPALVDHAVDIFRQDPPDLVTNVWPRSYPKGQSVEVIACAALTRVVADMTTAHEREHVTPRFYAHPEQYTIRSFATPRPRPDVQLSVDNEADLKCCEAILTALARPHWDAGWEACVAAFDALTAGQAGGVRS